MIPHKETEDLPDVAGATTSVQSSALLPSAKTQTAGAPNNTWPIYCGNEGSAMNVELTLKEILRKNTFFLNHAKVADFVL